MNVSKSDGTIPALGRASAVRRFAKNVAAAVTFAVAAGLSLPASSAGDPLAGAEAFGQYCAGCHVATQVPGRSPSYEVIQQHLIDMYEAGVKARAPGDSLDDIAAYLATLRNYGGLWENAPAGSETGWGLNIAHQGDTIFATWFTYDESGRGRWLAMTAAKTGPNTYAGEFYQTSGRGYSSPRLWKVQVAVAPVGTGTLTFSDRDNGSFAYDVDGVADVKNITRTVFGPLPGCGMASDAAELTQAVNYQDLWWAAPSGVEPGWGVHLTHQGDTIFATWFTYDADRSPLWLVVTARYSAPGVYAGVLYRTRGPAFHAASFDPAAVVPTAVGEASFTFQDGNHANFAYSVEGVADTRAITREVFAAPGTVCR